MTTYFLRSTDGSDADTGLTWDLAKATLVGAFAAMSASDDLHVSQVHAEEIGSSQTYTSPGTAALPCRVMCVNDSTGVLTTGASVAISSGAPTIGAGFAYWYGIHFKASAVNTSTASLNIANVGNPTGHVFEACAFELRTAHATPAIFVGTIGQSGLDDTGVVCLNCAFVVNSSGHRVSFRHGRHRLRGGSVTTNGASPDAIFGGIVGGACPGVRIVGMDLSALASALVDVSGASAADIRLERCRMHASATTVTGTHPGPGGIVAEIYNCDSGTTDTRNERHDYRGSVTTEDTIIKTDGASNGITSVSWKMVTSANVTMWDPLNSFEVTFFEAGTGSKTYGVEVVTDNVTLTDAQAWVEPVYGVSASHPLAGFGSDRAANVFATPVNQASSSVAWTTTGLTTPVKQRLAATVTVAMAGWITLRVLLARPSTTMYASPDVVTTGQREWMAPGVYVNEGAVAGGSGGPGPAIRVVTHARRATARAI